MFHANLAARMDKTDINTYKIQARLRYLNHIKSENNTKENFEEECLICKQLFQRAVATPCGHFYCSTCAKFWFPLHKKCPVCK